MFFKWFINPKLKHPSSSPNVKVNQIKVVKQLIPKPNQTSNVIIKLKQGRQVSQTIHHYTTNYTFSMPNQNEQPVKKHRIETAT